ncbi:glycoside hydrolase family 3 protein [Plantactinospora mayteni]|uniref:Beta-glucosidase n=1 Tax=Plantactinospora mayteni TaxID=566021 RepID=A0ABQ4EFT3_9ACTN|nr:glycoside hydrolase family 3 protein [Plantactinospora mayteni]GIG93515.1 beta-glucosidase [Plantactinospora mayteni]
MTGPAFRDPDLPLETRVADLLGRLTLPEKAGLLHQYQGAVPRLGLDRYPTGTEILHGVAWRGEATAFPQALGLASSWDPELLRAVGAAVGDEVRGLRRKQPERVSLNVWGPVVNPLRDPRWGRNEEGYSEDPWLTGTLATAYTAGLSGDHPRFLRTAPTLKHFLGYNNEDGRGETSAGLAPRVRYEYEYPAFRAPIEADVVVGLMCSYNRINGRPAHVSPLVNAEVRRWSKRELLVVSDAEAVSGMTKWQHYFDDHLVGLATALRGGIDCFTEDDRDSEPTVARVTEALSRGLISESDVDTAVRRSLAVRFRLGEFDPPEGNPYAAITPDVVNCAAHQRLARRAARGAMVLLANDGTLPLPDPPGRVAVVGPLADVVYDDWFSGTKPYAVTAYGGLAGRLGADAVEFRQGVDRIVLGGPYGPVAATDDPAGGPVRVDGAASEAATWIDVFDWGYGVVALRTAANNKYISVDEDRTLVNTMDVPWGWFLRETFRLLDHGPGRVVIQHVHSGRYVATDDTGVLRANRTDARDASVFDLHAVVDGARDAAEAAGGADVAVVVVGNHPLINGRESQDRPGLALPPAQEALVRAVYAANPRTVLVVTSSYPYAMEWVGDHTAAVLWSAHCGQEYGNALTDVLLGGTPDGAAVDVTGRLTQTWYRAEEDLPDILDYDIIARDATYRYHRGSPLYPFGFGLSYTTFAYTDLRLSAGAIEATGDVQVTARVANTGDRPGTEVVQLYVRQEGSQAKRPLRQLHGFARVTLAPGESQDVGFTLHGADLAYWDVRRAEPVVESGTYRVLVGRSSAATELSAVFTVRGREIGPRDPLRAPFEAANHDEYRDTVLTHEEPDGADAVSGTAPGAWTCFRAVDFGVGAVGTVTARLSALRPEAAGGHLTLRLDDPSTGPVIGRLPVPGPGGRGDWHTVSATLTGADGVRTLYLVFDAAGSAVSRLTFGTGAG